MREYLRVYTGVEPEITEEYGGFPLNDNSRLGLNTALARESGAAAGTS